jgi:GTPase KRas
VQFLLEVFQPDYDSTIEGLYKKKICVDSKTFSLTVLDTGGDPELESLRGQWCKTGKAFIIVFSATSRDSFNCIPLFEEEIRRHHKPGYPLALVATKADLKEEVSFAEGRNRAEQLGAGYFHLSAKDLRQAREPFVYLARRLASLDANIIPTATNPNPDSSLRPIAGAWTCPAMRVRIIEWHKLAFGSCIEQRKAQ